MKDELALVGYSVFDRFQECFEYVENECFIATTVGAAHQFSLNCMGDREDYEVREVSLEDVLADFGCSGGSYAMEPTAFRRLKALAECRGLDFETEARDLFDLVFVHLKIKK